MTKMYLNKNSATISIRSNYLLKEARGAVNTCTHASTPIVKIAKFARKKLAGSCLLFLDLRGS